MVGNQVARVILMSREISHLHLCRPSIRHLPSLPQHPNAPAQRAQGTPACMLQCTAAPRPSKPSSGLCVVLMSDLPRRPKSTAPSWLQVSTQEHGGTIPLDHRGQHVCPVDCRPQPPRHVHVHLHVHLWGPRDLHSSILFDGGEGAGVCRLLRGRSAPCPVLRVAHDLAYTRLGGRAAQSPTCTLLGRTPAAHCGLLYCNVYEGSAVTSCPLLSSAHRKRPHRPHDWPFTGHPARSQSLHPPPDASVVWEPPQDSRRRRR